MRIYILLLLLSSFIFANIGTIAGVKGKSTIYRNGKSIDIKRGCNKTIYYLHRNKVKDVINTKDNSKIQVIMKDKTIITIGENSEYSFDKYTYGNGQTPEVSMKLKRGFFRAITGKISKIAPKRFHIKTRSSTIGIRGTHFYANVTEEKETIGCIRGKIIVSTKLNNYILLAGHSVSLSKGVGKVSMASSSQKSKKPQNIGISKEVGNMDVLVNKAPALNIGSGSIITPPSTPNYDPDK